MDQRNAREKLIGKAKENLEKERLSLLEAKKSRKEKPSEKRIDGILKKFKVNRYLDYSLESVVITTERGLEVRTFNL